MSADSKPETLVVPPEFRVAAVNYNVTISWCVGRAVDGVLQATPEGRALNARPGSREAILQAIVRALGEAHVAQGMFLLERLNEVDGPPTDGTAH